MGLDFNGVLIYPMGSQDLFQINQLYRIEFDITALSFQPEVGQEN